MSAGVLPCVEAEAPPLHEDVRKGPSTTGTGRGHRAPGGRICRTRAAWCGVHGEGLQAGAHHGQVAGPGCSVALQALGIEVAETAMACLPRSASPARARGTAVLPLDSYMPTLVFAKTNPPAPPPPSLCSHGVHNKTTPATYVEHYGGLIVTCNVRVTNPCHPAIPLRWGDRAKLVTASNIPCENRRRPAQHALDGGCGHLHGDDLGGHWMAVWVVATTAVVGLLSLPTEGLPTAKPAALVCRFGCRSAL